MGFQRHDHVAVLVLHERVLSHSWGHCTWGRIWLWLSNLFRSNSPHESRHVSFSNEDDSYGHPSTNAVGRVRIMRDRVWHIIAYLTGSSSSTEDPLYELPQVTGLMIEYVRTRNASNDSERRFPTYYWERCAAKQHTRRESHH